MSKRYDTLVIEGVSSKDVPREAAGGRVVSWAQGHGLAESSALEEFVKALAEGAYEDATWNELEWAAREALDKASRQRDNGYEG